ncbi:MAG: hypothetical protein AAGK32_06435 [Actinomycetota bacterium]
MRARPSTADWRWAVLSRGQAWARRLPEAVGYPEVVGYGGQEGDDYLVTRRPQGQVLAHAWPP